MLAAATRSTGAATASTASSTSSPSSRRPRGGPTGRAGSGHGSAASIANRRRDAALPTSACYYLQRQSRALVATAIRLAPGPPHWPASPPACMI